MPKAKAGKKAIVEPSANVPWFSERAKEIGLSFAKISLDVMGHKDLLGRTLKGDRGFKPAELVALSKLLKVPLVALYRQLGYDVEGATCTIIGTINAQSRVSPLPPNQQLTIACPTELESKLVALRVDAPHSVLAIYHGTIFFYSPADKVRPDAFGRLSVVELGDHTSAIVGVLDRASVGRGRVVLFGTQESIESDEIISAAPIRWQRAG